MSSSEAQRPLERLKAMLTTIPHFNELRAETVNEIMAIATHCHFAAGQVIYLEGEPAEYVYILESGWVKATRITHAGREQGLLFLRPVEIFGDIAVFAGTSYPGTTTALEPVDAWRITAGPLLGLVQAHPDLAMLVIRRLSERVLHYVDLVEDLSLRSVEARLANSLLQNAELADGRLIVQRRAWATFDEMAVRLGTVRDVLGRALKTLEAEGLVQVERQAILLRDPQGLAERAKR